jgi:hypothetical protein
VERLQEENRSLTEQLEKYIQLDKEPKAHVVTLDDDEGLAKVMSELSVKEVRYQFT